MQYGVSFSIKQCRNFQVSPEACLQWLLHDAGFRRFRLMSYWDEIQPDPNTYDFSHLDAQLERISLADGVVSLCLGVRQPRWPENHWPQWAWLLPSPQRSAALLQFVQTVVERYRHNPAIVSYQLENEALLARFGERPDINRARLRQEYELVHQLDPTRPVIMSTSTTWGIPVRQPRPDIVGFSYYQKLYNPRRHKYTTAIHKPGLVRLRAKLVAKLYDRESFIHELQLEPWGPKNIWDMATDEQAKSMSPEQIKHNLRLAQATGLRTIDLWGGEWWYWRWLQQDSAVIDTIRQELAPFLCNHVG